MLLAGCRSRGKAAVSLTWFFSGFIETFSLDKRKSFWFSMELVFSEFHPVLKVSAMETPSRAEPVAQEDKTKLLKAAFLQFCRYVIPNTSWFSFLNQ